MPKQTIELREALRQALDEEMQRDETVIILGEEVAEYNGAYKVTKGLLDKWGPGRVLDTPISENAFAGLGIGAAMTGMRPVVEFMSWNSRLSPQTKSFPSLPKSTTCRAGVLKFLSSFVATNGAAAQVSCQHSHCVEALYSNLPGLIVVAPSNPYDAKGLLKASIRNDNPILFLENELDYGMKMEIPTEEYLVPLERLRLSGKEKISRWSLSAVC